MPCWRVMVGAGVRSDEHRAQPRPGVECLARPRCLAGFAADWLIARVLEARDPVGVCLSGGSTPQRLYERLAGEPYRSQFPWRRVHWFWGDERHVPPGDERSNAGAARRAPDPRSGSLRNQARPAKSGFLLEFFALSNRCLRLFSLVSDVDTPCLIRPPSGHPSSTSWTPFSGAILA